MLISESHMPLAAAAFVATADRILRSGANIISPASDSPAGISIHCSNQLTGRKSPRLSLESDTCIVLPGPSYTVGCGWLPSPCSSLGNSTSDCSIIPIRDTRKRKKKPATDAAASSGHAFPSALFPMSFVIRRSRSVLKGTFRWAR